MMMSSLSLIRLRHVRVRGYHRGSILKESMTENTQTATSIPTDQAQHRASTHLHNPPELASVIQRHVYRDPTMFSIITSPTLIFITLRNVMYFVPYVIMNARYYTCLHSFIIFA